MLGLLLVLSTLGGCASSEKQVAQAHRRAIENARNDSQAMLSTFSRVVGTTRDPEKALVALRELLAPDSELNRGGYQILLTDSGRQADLITIEIAVFDYSQGYGAVGDLDFWAELCVLMSGRRATPPQVTATEVDCPAQRPPGLRTPRIDVVVTPSPRR